MFYRTIFVCLVAVVLGEVVGKDPDISFKIRIEQNNITCDHSDDKKQLNKYTVLEGEKFTIVTNYHRIISHVICHANNNESNGFHYQKTNMKNVTTGEKSMGTFWNCTILTHRNTGSIIPQVHYKNASYTAAYCFMKIHVRQKELPQTILVNNMVVPAFRENNTEKDIDFTAEYQYGDGDKVNVACANLKSSDDLSLTMEYQMAGTSSDEFVMKNISSSKMIGFVTKLHSGHHNSYMICTSTGTTDYTKVMIRFVMQTKPNIISIAINGMIIRPKIDNVVIHRYISNCKFAINQTINVTCEVVDSANMKLFVFYDKFDNSSTKTEETNKKTELRFYLNPEDNKTLSCGADYDDERGQAESVKIQFTTADFPIDQYPSLHMDLPSNGTTMELYSYGVPQRTVIIYEFNKDETVQLKCGPLHLPNQPAPVLYLQFDNTAETCKTKGCNVSKTFEHLTREDVNTSTVCYLKEEPVPGALPTAIHTVHKEIRVILRERVSTIATGSTNTATSTSTRNTETEIQAETSSRATTSEHNTPSESPETAGNDDKPTTSPLSNLPMIAGSAACLIIICVSIAIIIIIRLRKRKHSQGGQSNRNYENLAEPSEAPIPAYPPQWENNYAVPVDHRTDDTTYSVPCPPSDLYATPTPKNLRNKKQTPLDPSYAVLAVQKGPGKKNIFKESDDPNYSEVYANRQEDSYAKVLPKSMRSQMEQENPYSYVTNEPSYVNTADPEPMYCEPGKAQGSEYANLNNSYYANSNAQEYVEPTYCEPQKRKK